MSQPSIWGVLDGELITDFPDIWSKTLVYSEEHGSILIVPRERNMTRFYIELKTVEASADKRQLAQAFVMEQARKIMAPYSLSWKYMEWFGRYQVGQRVANRFTDEHGQVFLAGDASHTHSPKSAQGMNTSIHDAWNLSWKLNLAVRGLAKPDLLASYEEERRKIALDLVNFDYEHANQIAAGDAIALAKNFRANVRFISGVGAEYAHSPVNRARGADAASFGMPTGEARPGCLLPPAKVTRYIDSNPVDVQIDIPMLGQFRIFLLMWDVQQAAPFLANLSHALGDTEKSLVCKLSAAASRSYAEQPRLGSPEDDFIRPERYTAVSHLFTFAVISKYLCGIGTASRLHVFSNNAKVGNGAVRSAKDAARKQMDSISRQYSRAGHQGASLHGEVVGRTAAWRSGHPQCAARRIRRLIRPMGRRRRRCGGEGGAVAR